MYDLIIIGASAVGCSAGIYAARRNLNFIIISKDIGGEVALSGEVENWPGTIHTTGIQLAKDFEKHVRSYGAKIEDGLEVTAILQEKNYHVVVTKDGAGAEKRFATKAVLIGSGIHPRVIDVPGEEALKGRGVTYCTVCDGPLYRGKTTATIGAGNSGLESALMMAGIAKKVYFLTKFPNTKETNGGFPKGENILVEKIKKEPNVEILYEANTSKILGTDFVEGLVYIDKQTGKEKTLQIQGAMIHVGAIPNSHFASNLEKNTLGEFVVNLRCETNIPGIFAAGDVTNIPFKQIVIASGQAVVAALSAIDYINRWKEI